MALRVLRSVQVAFGVVTFSLAIVASSRVLLATSNTAPHCDWDGECVDINCSVASGHCEGSNPQDCHCVLPATR